MSLSGLVLCAVTYSKSGLRHDKGKNPEDPDRKPWMEEFGGNYPHDEAHPSTGGLGVVQKSTREFLYLAIHSVGRFDRRWFTNGSLREPTIRFWTTRNAQRSHCYTVASW